MDPYEIIATALENAISTMTSMIVNEGQASVLNNTFIPDFERNALADPSEGWIPVNCSPYCDFMGETVEAGNQIMETAYVLAYALQKNLFKRLL
jgi:hypothetical protein